MTGNDTDNKSIEIPGIDTESGLALFGGDISIFLCVLRSFVSDALAVIEKIRHVSEDSLKDYAITVHGLKGICSGICAEKVRKMADELELKARSGDLSGVLAMNEELIKDTGILVSEVQTFLKNMTI